MKELKRVVCSKFQLERGFIAIIFVIVAAVANGCAHTAKDRIISVPPERYRAFDKARGILKSDAGVTTLYSLEPKESENDKARLFQGNIVLGKTELNRNEERVAREVFLSALGDSMAIDGGHLCFEPREALTIQNGASKFDFVICFECKGLQFFENDKFVAAFIVSGDRAKLDSILSHHSIPLSTSDQ